MTYLPSAVLKDSLDSFAVGSTLLVVDANFLPARAMWMTLLLLAWVTASQLARHNRQMMILLSAALSSWAFGEPLGGAAECGGSLNAFLAQAKQKVEIRIAIKTAQAWVRKIPPKFLTSSFPSSRVSFGAGAEQPFSADFSNKLCHMESNVPSSFLFRGATKVLES